MTDSKTDSNDNNKMKKNNILLQLKIIWDADIRTWLQILLYKFDKQIKVN